MSNIILSQRTAFDIDKRVAKVLKDLDDPEPPLDLSSVRELLGLDLQYYSSDDEGILQEVIHQLRIGAKQVLLKPTRILTAIRKRSLRALWVPQPRRILLDTNLHQLKQRWGEGHEILHSLIPHHEILTLGDPEYTLSPGCHSQIEAEANYGTGRLLFLRSRFVEEMLGGSICFDRVKKLSKVYGNTITSTLWRTIEAVEEPAIGLVSIHPWGNASDTSDQIRHFIRNNQFIEEFANISQEELFRKLARVVHRRGCGLIGENEALLTDVNGDEHVFSFECFATKYDTLTIGLYRSPKLISIAVPNNLRS